MKVRDINDINEIIVHCSDSGFGDFELIDLWHKDRGWDMCGYHEIILNGYLKDSKTYIEDYDGELEEGRPLDKVGAHCKGHNARSIGICLIGIDEFTPAQLDTLLDQLEYYCQEFNIDPDSIHGHYEFSDKACPNFPVEPIRDIIKERMEQ